MQSSFDLRLKNINNSLSTFSSSVPTENIGSGLQITKMDRATSTCDIGKYIYCRDPDFLLHDESEIWSDLDNSIKSFDHILHQWLDEIFRDCCLDSSEMIKEFLRDHQNNTEPILDQEPVLSKCFSKNELKKCSLLWIAILAGYHKSAELLVRSGADVNEIFGYHDPQVIREQWTFLHLLIKRVHLGIDSSENERLFRLVMDHGANLEARDSYGRTVLHYAVLNGQIEIVKMLLEKGADVSAKNSSGDSALFYLLSPGDEDKLIEMARILIEKGISINDRDADGCLSIHWAIKYRFVRLVELYLDYGADPNAQLEGVSLLHFATSLYYKGFSFKQLIELLLKYGANIDERTTDGDTVLHQFCELQPYCNPEILKVFLSAGADVLAENFNGKTPYALISAKKRRAHRICIRLVYLYEAKIIIKALAVKKTCNPMITLKDEKEIEGNPVMWKYYQECLKEINGMRIARFFENCTLFDLLVKSECLHMAKLMRKHDFETKFKLYNLKEFPIYAEYLHQVAFRRVQRQFHSIILEQEDVINEAVYNILPYLVVRTIVRYIFNDDDCAAGICFMNKVL